MKSAAELVGIRRAQAAAESGMRAAAAVLAQAVPDGETPFSYLSELCWAGARKRYHPLTSAVVNRLAHELDVIERAGLAEFFLICWDLMRFAREQGIPAQGRGSAASSIVTGSFCRISSVTGFWMRTESPRSPCANSSTRPTAATTPSLPGCSLEIPGSTSAGPTC